MQSKNLNEAIHNLAVEAEKFDALMNEPPLSEEQQADMNRWMEKDAELKPWDKCKNVECGKPGKFLGSFCDDCHNESFKGRYLSTDHLLTMRKADLGG